MELKLIPPTHFPRNIITIDRCVPSKSPSLSHGRSLSSSGPSSSNKCVCQCSWANVSGTPSLVPSALQNLLLFSLILIVSHLQHSLYLSQNKLGSFLFPDQTWLPSVNIIYLLQPNQKYLLIVLYITSHAPSTIRGRVNVLSGLLWSSR